MEAGPRFFPRICSTHTFADRVATCHRVIAAGMELCSGGIFGMGETWSDRLDLAFALRDLGTREIPCNFLDPRAGTPLGGETPLRPLDALRCTAMMRLVNPRAVVRYAGGRELVLRDLQAYGKMCIRDRWWAAPECRSGAPGPPASPGRRAWRGPAPRSCPEW